MLTLKQPCSTTGLQGERGWEREESGRHSGAEGEMEKSKRHTRSVGPVYDLDIVFEKTKMYSPVTKLPTYGGVVGMLR